MVFMLCFYQNYFNNIYITNKIIVNWALSVMKDIHLFFLSYTQRCLMDIKSIFKVKKTDNSYFNN